MEEQRYELGIQSESDERKINKWFCFDVEKEYDGDEDQVIWSHRPKNTACKKDDTQAEEGQTCTWLQDLKDGTKLDIWRMHPNWRLMVKVGLNSSVTAAQIAPPDE